MKGRCKRNWPTEMRMYHNLRIFLTVLGLCPRLTRSGLKEHVHLYNRIGIDEIQASTVTHTCHSCCSVGTPAQSSYKLISCEYLDVDRKDGRPSIDRIITLRAIGDCPVTYLELARQSAGVQIDPTRSEVLAVHENEIALRRREGGVARNWSR
jgi:hypothetical protein